MLHNFARCRHLFTLLHSQTLEDRSHFPPLCALVLDAVRGEIRAKGWDYVETILLHADLVHGTGPMGVDATDTCSVFDFVADRIQVVEAQCVRTPGKVEGEAEASRTVLFSCGAESGDVRNGEGMCARVYAC